MMTCKEVTERASALIDGEVGLWERLQIQLHLAICKGCARFVSQMRVTRMLTETALPPLLPDSTESARIDAILTELRTRPTDG
ncbi:anti-sigma factor family protein [Acidimangrovimonas sediminis]|uniref:anti-sigma factor family protein n=1 Tax=Acidimangrovimonas sediminis TaxID=2056283 RepID=UPI000C8060CE|nr:zf-HC2 domain-containing protein [Acidimangrovimonas sediminis]